MIAAAFVAAIIFHRFVLPINYTLIIRWNRAINNELIGISDVVFPKRIVNLLLSVHRQNG